MRYLVALAAFGLTETCLAGSPLAGDFPSLIAAVRGSSAISATVREEFERGVSSWNDNRFLSARNHWVRAKAWLEKSPAPQATGPDALDQLIDEADRLSQPEPEIDPTPVPSPAPRRPRAHTHRSMKRKTSTANARKVMEHARAAQRAGQTEKAARLMRIASTLPGGEEAAAQADALEREVVSGTGSGW